MLLTTAQVADRLHYSQATVVRLIRDGKLKAVRRGPKGNYRVPEAEVANYFVDVQPATRNGDAA